VLRGWPSPQLRRVRHTRAPDLFAINDLDETLPGPGEWDLKRLAASFVVACRDNGLKDAVAKEVLCMTTLRLRELLNRRWSEIHLEGQAPQISVPHTKTGVPKKIPLPKVAVEALKRLISDAVDGPEALVPEGDFGGVDGTRTRDLRRDRQKE
jgi:integrase